MKDFQHAKFGYYRASEIGDSETINNGHAA